MLISDTVFNGVKSSKYFAKVNPKQDRQEIKFFNLCEECFNTLIIFSNKHKLQISSVLSKLGRE